jgi:outer membrane protein TolC
MQALHARRFGWAVASVLLVFSLSTAAAEPIPGRTVDSVRAWLIERNPELRAVGLEAEAAEARVYPAGALPDPSASLALRGPDVPWRQGEGGREVDYALRQRFPLWGKRGLARSVVQHEAIAANLERDALARDLLAEAEAAYVRYWHADKAVAVLDRRIALLRQIEEMAGVRYALGRAAQQDAIRAQVEQTTLLRERIDRVAAKDVAIAELNALLGRAANDPLAPPAGIPALPVQSPKLSVALGEAEAHPAVLSQREVAEAAMAASRLERRNRFPDFTLDIGVMQLGDGVESMELMLEVEIPFQQRARREREREARLLHDAALARANQAQRVLQGRGASAWAQWQSARERRLLIENRLMPQADATYQSALASYQVGEVDFSTLLEALNGWQGADLARVDTLREELTGAVAVRAIEGEMP